VRIIDLVKPFVPDVKSLGWTCAEEYVSILQSRSGSDVTQ